MGIEVERAKGLRIEVCRQRRREWNRDIEREWEAVVERKRGVEKQMVGYWDGKGGTGKETEEETFNLREGEGEED